MITALAGVNAWRFIDLLIYQIHRTDLQQAADTAALAATKEASLKGWNSENAKGVALEYIAANASSQFASSVLTPTVEVSEVDRIVNVAIAQDHYSYFVLGYFKHSPQILVRARAKASGEGIICLIITAPTGKGTFNLKGSGRVNATECSAYSNSVDPKAIVASNTALLKSKLTCTAGGYAGKLNNFAPIPLTDCPTISDPLVGRAQLIDNLIEPSVCNFQGVKISGEKKTITPGTYCKDLKITKNSDVTMAPGIYVFKDGKVRLDGGSKLTGAGAGFVFVGDKSVIELKNDSIISLTAPTSGPMAGVLFYGQPSSKSREFKFESENAQKLVGTVYLPNDKLTIGGDKDGDGTCDPDLEDPTPLTTDCNANVGEASAWTAIVADQVEVTAGANLVLNTGYAGSPVPVPLGIGPSAGTIALVK